MPSPSPTVDVIEAGRGPAVILIHSSVSGARQWRRLMADLEDRFHLRALNLFGYGATPAWPNERPQSLDDHVDLVAAALPADGEPVCLIGHSFGGSVAMKAAMRLGARVDRLILFEPNPFYLLRDNGRPDAFAEAWALRDFIKLYGAREDWMAAAERFAEYWAGAGSWGAMPPERRDAFAAALRPNVFEWDAVMAETTPLAQWAASLPQRTLVVTAAQTVRPSREIAELLRQACPHWRFDEVADGGHMAPLTRPDLVNPIVRSFLEWN